LEGKWLDLTATAATMPKIAASALIPHHRGRHAKKVLRLLTVFSLMTQGFDTVQASARLLLSLEAFDAYKRHSRCSSELAHRTATDTHCSTLGPPSLRVHAVAGTCATRQQRGTISNRHINRHHKRTDRCYRCRQGNESRLQVQSCPACQRSNEVTKLSQELMEDVLSRD